MTINEETAQLLQRVAAVFRVKEGDTFRYKAYINASIAVENLTEPVTAIWKRGELDKIPGFGESLSMYLAEYFTTGRVRHFESIFNKVPAGMFPLMTIRGIGPVTAYKIAKKFRLNDQETALDDLKEILLSGELSRIAGFKEKTIAKIQKSLDIKSFGKNRIPLYETLSVAEDFIAYITKSKDVIEAQPLGSLRRRLATIGDIDLAICTDNPARMMEYALSYLQISAVITQGEKVSHVKLINGLEVDLKISLPASWGSLLQHYTGSKLHNIHLRTLAKEKGLSLSEYGITQNGKLKHFTSEEKFYGFLGMEYIPPEIRENSGEIEMSLSHKLPQLIDLSDIKGDLHVHSDFNYPSSHDIGVSPLSQLLSRAADLGYQYLGLADHNPKFQGLTEGEKNKIIHDRKQYLLSQYRAYEKSVKHRTINLLIGMEVDIRPDGSLALSDSIMESLDYVITSIHTSFDLTAEANTRRIIKALSHPKVKILGHPTCRIINGREPIHADWEKIFTFCASNKKIIEINAYPTRLDLPDDLIRLAVSSGCKLIINTDSHTVDQLSVMRYGVWQARRGYATSKDIVNSFSNNDLHSMLESK